MIRSLPDTPSFRSCSSSTTMDVPNSTSPSAAVRKNTTSAPPFAIVTTNANSIASSNDSETEDWLYDRPFSSLRAGDYHFMYNVSGIKHLRWRSLIQYYPLFGIQSVKTLFCYILILFSLTKILSLSFLLVVLRWKQRVGLTTTVKVNGTFGTSVQHIDEHRWKAQHLFITNSWFKHGKNLSHIASLHLLLHKWTLMIRSILLVLFSLVGLACSAQTAQSIWVQSWFHRKNIARSYYWERAMFYGSTMSF